MIEYQLENVQITWQWIWRSYREILLSMVDGHRLQAIRITHRLCLCTNRWIYQRVRKRERRPVDERKRFPSVFSRILIDCVDLVNSISGRASVHMNDSREPSHPGKALSCAIS